ncbi:hypothetical protein SFR_5202 [Streptomyces sp. FR-008]|nr:hypothetical protein SFR_5202 [Streptomyces sp. FR-008]
MQAGHGRDSLFRWCGVDGGARWRPAGGERGEDQAPGTQP